MRPMSPLERRVAELEEELRTAREAARSAAQTAEHALRRLIVAERVAKAIAAYWRGVDRAILKEAEDSITAWERSRS
jgi:hypothetical protein